MISVTCTSLEDSNRLGFLIGEQLQTGDIICLSGPLGVGKTTIAKAIARGAGILEEEYVTSPTYTIVNEYQGRKTLYHMDLYRLDSDLDVLELGLDEYFYYSGITMIEWFERAEKVIPDHRIILKIEMVGAQQRRFELTGSALLETHIKDSLRATGIAVH
ncbi:MAG: tRNA (adenosine(37)-N6)-threonylcarbamoyltransferase complex ATPase subunit type 1 TsaE [Desulfobulbaceae bacterium]|nr:MAG: tRNA (adenosine(37)-N6)-threonylcarbamoyltransferase complex ATPase subunit type 1 TsaE [Desulfobulbaceae bacterium]